MEDWNGLARSEGKLGPFSFVRRSWKSSKAFALEEVKGPNPHCACPKPSLVFLHFFKLHVATTCNLTHTNLFLPAYGWHSPCHDNSAVQCCREQAILFKVERKRVCLYHMQLSSRQDAVGVKEAQKGDVARGWCFYPPLIQNKNREPTGGGGQNSYAALPKSRLIKDSMQCFQKRNLPPFLFKNFFFNCCRNELSGSITASFGHDSSKHATYPYSSVFCCWTSLICFHVSFSTLPWGYESDLCCGMLLSGMPINLSLLWVCLARAQHASH